MSQAEDKLENNRLKYIDYTFKRHGIDPESKEGQLIYYAYGHGYHQAEKDILYNNEKYHTVQVSILDELYDIKKKYEAEKDLALTCDDIKIIVNAFLDYKIEATKSGKTKKYTDEEYCKEVLKRFLETKALTNKQ